MLLMLNTCSVLALDIAVKVEGRVFIAPCQVNNGNTIEFTFDKSIDTNKVDGVAYAQAKTIPISCGYYLGTPYIKIIGPALSGAPDNVLKATVAQSSTSAFGLALYQGSTVNSNYKLLLGAGENGLGFPVITGLTGKNTSNGNFTFTAVPYSNSSKLTGGNFSATANLSISYL